MDDTKWRILTSHAREYVAMGPVLKFDDILAHAEKEYRTEDERVAFRDAVLHEEIVRSQRPRYSHC